MSLMQADLHVEIARLQKEIQTHFGLKEDNLIFDFKDHGGRTKLNLVTVNPRHEQSFLFHSVEGIDKVDALQKMLSYVKTYRDSESSYTIQWSAKSAKELQTSYFRARNIHEALDKLFYGRDMNAITVFSVVLNPLT